MSTTASHADPLTDTPAGERFDVTIHDRLEAAETAWRSLELRGVLTPYQRYDWLRVLLAAGAERTGRMAIAVISRDGRTVAILPLLIERHWGVTSARMLGTRQSNSDWILSEPDFLPSPAQLRGLFADIARQAGGIDMLSLFNQPANWLGVSNPVLEINQAPAASNLYTATIGPTPVPYIDHRLSAKRRSNIKRGARRLEETLGPVRLVRVSDAAAVDQVHAVFLEQRAARFDAMGVDNIFAQPPFPQFFQQLVSESFGSARPALCLHALYAGDEIVATSWGAMVGNHYSQYINSTSSGPAARYSLMGILVGELMDDLIQAGITTFDMGLGDFDYKVEWTEPQPVFHSVMALTAKGRVAAALQRQREAAKRLIKQTPSIWRVAKWARRHSLRLRRQ